MKKTAYTSFYTDLHINIDLTGADYFVEQELVSTAADAFGLGAIEIKIFRPSDGRFISFEFETPKEICKDIEEMFDYVIARLSEKRQENTEKRQEYSEELPY